MKRLIALFGCAVLTVSLLSAVAMSADGASLYGSCKGCHGADGSKVALGVAPALKGQSAEDLLKKLQGYKDGTFKVQDKTAPMMTKMVQKYNDEELKALADYMASF